MEKKLNIENRPKEIPRNRDGHEQAHAPRNVRPPAPQDKPQPKQ